MTESHLLSNIILSPQYCSFCVGSPQGRKGVECEYYSKCLNLVRPGFEIPKDKKKIETYIKHYNGSKPLYEIAEIIWEEKDTEKIKEKANQVDTIEPLPNVLMMPLARRLDEEYLKNKVKDLRECAQR